MMFAEIIVEVSSSQIDKVFDYEIPSFISHIELIGKRALVPFGPRKIEGYVIDIKNDTKIDKSKLKPIIKILDDQPVILPEMINLMKFMTEKFHLKKVDVLRLFIPAEMRSEKIKSVFVKEYILNNNFNLNELKLNKNAKKQQEIIDFLKENKTIHQSDAKNFSSSSLKKLEELGIILSIQTQKFRNPLSEIEAGQTKKIEHTPAQKKVISEIGENGIYLLHGVTGSGKTEVYMSVIEKVVEKGKTAIMLVPEISLTPQVLRNFRERFGETVAILHSGLSAGERYDEWCRLLSGDAKIAVGARSAIFAPVKNVGAIIIDEEHDGSYISDNNPRFNTFEIAKFRAESNACCLILGSATPSVETYEKTVEGKIKLLELPVRVNGRDMPKVEIVDMLGEIREGNNSLFSRRLIGELDSCFKNNKQAMLFLNRRGFTSFMMCRECGYIAKCSDCDVSLVYHKYENKLKCHYCGKTFKALTACPECGSTHIREGAVGTEKVCEEIKRLFPNVKVFRMDNDTTRTKNAHYNILNQFKNTKPSVLVGTQMIAKGHDFSEVTLVGIIDADQGLFQSHYKSAERTFSLLTQVSGRAGRSEDEGKVILQTYCPRHYVYNFAANYNYKGFFEKENNLRKASKFPPYSTILRILLSSENQDKLEEITKKDFEGIKKIREKNQSDFIYLNVMKAPVGKIKNKFRFQILIRLENKNVDKITKLIYNVCDENISANVSTFVEINPQSLN